MMVHCLVDSSLCLPCASVQIGVFGAVVIQDDWKAWLLLGAAFSCTMAGIAVHALCTTPASTSPKECPNSFDIDNHLHKEIACL